MKRFFIAISVCIISACQAQNTFKKICDDYLAGYLALAIPPTSLDYKTNFENIRDTASLLQQKQFFLSEKNKLLTLDQKKLNPDEKIRIAQLQYEVDLNLQRITLETEWNHKGRIIPQGGFYSMDRAAEWYSYYVKYFTSVNITPAQVFAMGESEVKKVQVEIDKIRLKLGYANEAEFYKQLTSDSFFITDKSTVIAKYAAIDAQVRKGATALYPADHVAEIGLMGWPDATASTPPGMYQDKERNAYGKDVFLFNFYGHKHNERSMQWLYMHEGIPGHHLQSVIRRNNRQASPLQNKLFYFGNAEGWACYVEDHGKEIGMFSDDYDYLGKWQWDLVRSARLVMEVGIHYYGWNFDKAMQYWKENIKGQDEIAEREIRRITNWAGQALCYKVGALTIEKIVAKKMEEGMDRKAANTFLLKHSDVPLQVLVDVG